MPRPGVRYDDIAEAIDTLEKAGLNPSIRMIREKLGQGSLTTIAEHKRAFEAKRAEGPGPALPDPVARHLIDGASAFWQELVEAAEAEIEAVRAKTGEAARDMEQRLSASEERAAELQDKLDAKNRSIESFQKAAEEQTAALAECRQTIQTLEIEVDRGFSQRDATKAQLTEVQSDAKALQQALTESEAERARLNERIDHQAAEFAKDKSTLQQHFNEYKDRLVTMADDVHQANAARHQAEKAAAESDKRATTSERDIARLERDIADLKDEVRGLTEKLGEAHGKLAAADDRLISERAAFERLLDEKDQRASSLSTSLNDAQELVRRYVPKGKDLAKELIDERRQEAAKE